MAGTTKPKLVGALACSMMGADMCVSSLSALVETIAPDAAQMLEINRVPITYFLCFCGWRTQYILRPEPEPEQPPGEAAADGAKKEGAETDGAAAEEAREPEVRAYRRSLGWSLVSGHVWMTPQVTAMCLSAGG